ncbi:hypothetical protein AB0H12_35090 [Actinosynnema sp. NPDC023794]
MAEATGQDTAEPTGRLLDAPAGLSGLTGRDLTEPDWLRLLDALLLVAVHPDRGKGGSVSHEQDLVARVVVARVVLLEVLLGLLHQFVLVLALDRLAAGAGDVPLHRNPPLVISPLRLY